MKTKLVALFIFVYLSLNGQTTNVTTLGSIVVSCSEYVNNMNKTWNINIPGNRRLILDYQVRVEHSYDKVNIYSINDSGTAVLQATLTGSQTGSIQSLYPNGKMKVVFTSDVSVNCSTNSTYSGITIKISKITGLAFNYDANGNRTNREIVLESGASTFRSDTWSDEEIVFHEKVDIMIDDKVQNADIRIYPNPTEGRFAVSISGVSDEISGKIYLLDLTGQQIEMKLANRDNKTEFDLSGKPAGVYLLKIQLGENISTWKIIKK